MEEITQLKNQLTTCEKQCEDYAKCCKELNEKNETRVNKAIDTFNKQIKGSETHRKEL